MDKNTNETFAAKFIRCRKQEERQKVNRKKVIQGIFVAISDIFLPPQVRDEIGIMNVLEHPRLLQLAAAYENPREIIMASSGKKEKYRTYL